MSLEFCDYHGCCETASHAYRKTSKDILRHYCDAHAVKMGFEVGHEPADATYASYFAGGDICVKGFASREARRVRQEASPRKHVGKRSGGPRPKPMHVVDAVGTILKTYASIPVYAKEKGVHPDRVYAAAKRQRRVGGDYVRMDGDPRAFAPKRKWRMATGAVVAPGVARRGAEVAS